MEEIKRFLEDLGLSITIFIAGAFGSWISLKEKSQLKWWERISFIIAGAIIANYITPLLLEFIEMPTSFELGWAFMCGYLGYEAVMALGIRIKGILKGRNKDE